MNFKKQSLLILSLIILIILSMGRIDTLVTAKTLNLPAASSMHGPVEPTASPAPSATNSPPATATQTIHIKPTATPTVQSRPTETVKPTQAPATGNANTSSVSLTLPIRAAFFYPWFPESWDQSGVYPFSMYKPAAGYYSSTDPTILHQQVDAMLYGNIQAGIASWWGPGSRTDQRMPLLLAAAAGTNFKWAVYYEMEGQGNPSASVINSDLIYLRDHYSNDPAYLHVDNRFVVFVYGGKESCDTVDRWKQANSVNAYLDLKIFPGYQKCQNQPDGWHQYAPAKAEQPVGSSGFTISPGLWKVGENPQLARNLQVWKLNIQDMVASGADFQLITTFNEWGEGTAIESASPWSTASGYGAYLDALHQVATSKP